MKASQPRVSIGLPVYNGERYLKEALDSILGQTFKEFELIISDNASTDKTEEICRSYMERDDRIQYHRCITNQGAAWNFNQVFKLSKGQYFKWAAHDDICAAEYLEQCVDVLDQDPDVVVCFSRTIQIDENGHQEKKREHIELPGLGSPRMHERFHDIILNRHGCESVFGLIRADKLQQTPLIGTYIASDRVLLALLSILGKFTELPDYLFSQREHAGRSVKGKDHEVTAWFDPTRGKEIVFPCWRLFREYSGICIRTSMPFQERILCFWQVAKWVKSNSQLLRWDLSAGIDRVLLLRGTRPVYGYLQKWVLSDRFPAPKWIAKSIALVVMFVVEGTYKIVSLVDLRERK